MATGTLPGNVSFAVCVFAPCGARGAVTAAARSWGGKNDVMLCWPLGGGPPAAAPPSLMMVVIGSGVVVCGAREGGRPTFFGFEDFIKISSRIYPAPRSLDF